MHRLKACSFAVSFACFYLNRLYTPVRGWLLPAGAVHDAVGAGRGRNSRGNSVERRSEGGQKAVWAKAWGGSLAGNSKCAGARFVCPCCVSFCCLHSSFLHTAALHPTWSSHSCSWTHCPRSRSNTACELRSAKFCVNKSGSRGQHEHHRPSDGLLNPPAAAGAVLTTSRPPPPP